MLIVLFLCEMCDPSVFVGNPGPLHRYGVAAHTTTLGSSSPDEVPLEHSSVYVVHIWVFAFTVFTERKTALVLLYSTKIHHSPHSVRLPHNSLSAHDHDPCTTTWARYVLRNFFTACV